MEGREHSRMVRHSLFAEFQQKETISIIRASMLFLSINSDQCLSDQCQEGKEVLRIRTRPDMDHKGTQKSPFM